MSVKSEPLFNSKFWSDAIIAKVQRYVDVMYKGDYRDYVRVQYTFRTQENAERMAEWHEHPCCPIVFTKSELQEIFDVMQLRTMVIG